jgi:hypothetical protein
MRHDEYFVDAVDVMDVRPYVGDEERTPGDVIMGNTGNNYMHETMRGIGIESDSV